MEIWNVWKEASAIDLQSEITILPHVDWLLEPNAYTLSIDMSITTPVPDRFWTPRDLKSSDVRLHNAIWLTRKMPLWPFSIPYIYPSHHRTIDAVKYHELEWMEIWNVWKQAIRINLQSKITLAPYVAWLLESHAYRFIVWIWISTPCLDRFWTPRDLKSSDVRGDGATWLARDVPLWASASSIPL